MINRLTPSIAIMLMVFAVLCGSPRLHAQDQKTTPPYRITPKESNWLEKKGFYIAGYDWSNEEVNYNLLMALEQRKRVQKTWLIGGLAAGGSIVLGVVGVVGVFATGINDEVTVLERIFTGVAVVGYVSFWGSLIVTPILAIIKSSKARKFVQLAIGALEESGGRS